MQCTASAAACQSSAISDVTDAERIVSRRYLRLRSFLAPCTRTPINGAHALRCAATGLLPSTPSASPTAGDAAPTAQREVVPLPCTTVQMLCVQSCSQRHAGAFRHCIMRCTSAVRTPLSITMTTAESDLQDVVKELRYPRSTHTLDERACRAKSSLQCGTRMPAAYSSAAMQKTMTERRCSRVISQCAPICPSIVATKPSTRIATP